ncbi:MAG: haloacid dehalogenase type II [Myxococcota bacterium]
MVESQVCVFDAYGTLFDVAAPVRNAALHVAKAEAIAEIWRVRQLEYTWLRTMMERYVDFWQVTCDALDYALEATQCSDDDLRRALLASYRQPTLYPDVIEALQTVSGAGVRCAILSNATVEMLQHGAEHTGIHTSLDAMISVHGVGVFKPDPRVYKLAETHFGLPIQQQAFVTSNAWDAAGAALAGFRVIWVNRLGRPRERLPGSVDAELSDLSGLPGVLGL